MSEAFDEVSSAVPLFRLRRVWLKSTVTEIQFVPSCHHFSLVQRPMKLRGLVLLSYGGKCGKEGLDSAHVRTTYLGKPGIRECRIEVLAVTADSVMHRIIEILLRPIANSGCRIRSDVRGINSPEGRCDSESARVRLADRIGMARRAIARINQIASSLDSRVSGALRPGRNDIRE